MKIGLIGLKKSGKTTIFNALTRMDIAIDQYSSAKDEPNVAAVHGQDRGHIRLILDGRILVYGEGDIHTGVSALNMVVLPDFFGPIISPIFMGGLD